MAELRRILHVDDDDDISAIVTLALEEVGQIAVCHCESGPTALDKAPGFGPDLFLLDYMMPGMDGQETARRLHEISGLEDVPVVFITARAQDDTTKMLLAAGAIGVVSKPFDPMNLADQLRQFWQTHHAT